MSKHNVRGTASGEYECSCGARWDRDEGGRCPGEFLEDSPLLARHVKNVDSLPAPEQVLSADHDEHGNRVEALAAFIRGVDGNNRMGAGALAERIIEWQARAALSANHSDQVLVPIKPTAAMLSAAFDVTGESEGMRTRVNMRMLKLYRAMLAASPSAGSQKEKQAKDAPYMSDDAEPRETWAEGYNAAMRNA